MSGSNGALVGSDSSPTVEVAQQCKTLATTTLDDTPPTSSAIGTGPLNAADAAADTATSGAPLKSSGQGDRLESFSDLLQQPPPPSPHSPPYQAPYQVGGKRSSFSPLFLVALFSLSVLVGFTAVGAVLSLVVRSSNWRASTVIDQGEENPIFADALVVNQPGVVVRVPHSSALLPADASDFLFFTWFKLRRTLTAEDRLVFVAKYDPTTQKRPGYSIGVSGGPDGVRPVVYWQDDSGKGRWVTFASSKVQPKEWYLMAVSFRQNRFLGVHMAPLKPELPIEALGGYDFDGIRPSNESELVVGAFGGSKFKGRLGPFGVIQKAGLSEEISALLERLRASPGAVPAGDESSVALWASPLIDLGQSKIPLTTPNGRPGRPRASR